MELVQGKFSQFPKILSGDAGDSEQMNMYHINIVYILIRSAIVQIHFGVLLIPNPFESNFLQISILKTRSIRAEAEENRKPCFQTIYFLQTIKHDFSAYFSHLIYLFIRNILIHLALLLLAINFQLTRIIGRDMAMRYHQVFTGCQLSNDV